MTDLEHIEIEREEESGTYISDILLNSEIITKVKNKGNLDIEKTEGTNSSMFSKLSRKNIVYYGIMEGEQNIKIEQATTQFQAPLIRTQQLRSRLEKLNEETRKKIGYIHINTIQIILKSTFREGIKTPVTLRVLDNRIKPEKYSILGEIEGDLGYTVIKFCVSLQFPIPLCTKKIDNCIGIVCDFKEKHLMDKGDIPMIACYRVAYALSNSCLSMNYRNQDRIYTDKIFQNTSTFIKSDKIQRDFLVGCSTRFCLPDLPLTPVTIEKPISRATLFNKDIKKEEIKLDNQIKTLQNKTGWNDDK